MPSETVQTPRLRQPRQHNQDATFLRLAGQVKTAATAAGLPEAEESGGSFSWKGKPGTRHANQKVLILVFWGAGQFGLGIRQDLVETSSCEELKALPWGQAFKVVGSHQVGFYEFLLADDDQELVSDVSKLLSLTLASSPQDERRAEFRRQFAAINV
jgi:hypothetical protein